MSHLRSDLDELGRQLWPDGQSLRPRPSPRRKRSRRAVLRRRGMEPLLVGATAIVMVGLLAGAFALGRAHNPAAPVPVASSLPARSVTAADLARGSWSTLPPAPISPRSSAAVLWTGSELLVWGGTDVADPHAYADGASYDPATGSWRMLAPAPLSARSAPAAVWDGSEMVIWGGIGINASFLEDGAAYNPQTNRWRTLPPAPLASGPVIRAVWTGSLVVMFGEAGTYPQQLVPYPQVQGLGIKAQLAAYDPAEDRWTAFPSPAPPSGHTLEWHDAVQAGDELIAWSDPEQPPPPCSASAGCSPDAAIPADVFAYDESARAWHLVAHPGAFAPYGVANPVWTGTVVLGGAICGLCMGPPRAQSWVAYNPTTATVTTLPENPIAWSQPLWTWAGNAIFSFNAPGPAVGHFGNEGTVTPGEATAYDALHGWLHVPSAPFGCTLSSPLVWTGHQVLLYCPTTPTGPGGLAFTPGQ